MSKALKKVESEKQIFSILEAQLKRQDEQGKTIHTMFESMKIMYGDFSQKFEVMTEMVQEVRDSVVISNAQCTIIQSDVSAKSNQLAKDRYEEGEGKFTKVVGFYRRMIWKQLKSKYDLPKYNCLRKIDFEEGRTFIQTFRPEEHM